MVTKYHFYFHLFFLKNPRQTDPFWIPYTNIANCMCCHEQFIIAGYVALFLFQMFKLFYDRSRPKNDFNISIEKKCHRPCNVIAFWKMWIAHNSSCNFEPWHLVSNMGLMPTNLFYSWKSTFSYWNLHIVRNWKWKAKN